MRIVVGLVAVAGLSGCSALFQERLEHPRDESVAPECTTGKGWVVVDTVFAIAAAGGILYNVDGTKDYAAFAITANALQLVVHLLSAGVGNSGANECREANREWDDRPAPQRSLDLDADDEPRPAPKPVEKPRVVRPPVPRGYFCSVSLATGFCMREKATCEQARAASLGAMPDLTTCTLVETAWCYDAERCAPSKASCKALREQAAGDDADTCDEWR